MIFCIESLTNVSETSDSISQQSLSESAEFLAPAPEIILPKNSKYFIFSNPKELDEEQMKIEDKQMFLLCGFNGTSWCHPCQYLIESLFGAQKNFNNQKCPWFEAQQKHQKNLRNYGEQALQEMEKKAKIGGLPDDKKYIYTIVDYVKNSKNREEVLKTLEENICIGFYYIDAENDKKSVEFGVNSIPTIIFFPITKQNRELTTITLAQQIAPRSLNDFLKLFERAVKNGVEYYLCTVIYDIIINSPAPEESSESVSEIKKELGEVKI